MAGGTSQARMPVRVKASLIHLAVSASIALYLLGVVFLIWYPPPLDRAAGVFGIFLMLVGVDVAIGPFVTLIVFNPKKKSLKFDLTVVAVLQFSALIYGVHAVFEARPAYVVFNVDRFDLVTANDLDPKSQAKTKEAKWRRPPVAGPRWVGALIPTDRDEKNALLFQAAQGGFDLPQLPQYYVPLARVTDQIKARMQSLEVLKNLNAVHAKECDRLLAPYLAHADAYGFVPLRGKAEDEAVIVERSTGNPVKTLTLSPWKD